MKYRKVLSKYYIQWFFDCHKSAVFCERINNKELAREYLDDAREYLYIIMENLEAIDFFSIDTNAHVVDWSLPKKFRGYE